MHRDRDEAQQRADQVRAFRAEVEALAREGLVAMPPDQAALVSSHHDRLLAAMSEAFDVDITSPQKQLSWGMRIAAFLGASAMAAAIFFLFYRYWGFLGTTAQVSVLVTAPLVAIVGVEVAARRERTGYVAAIAALVAFACFVLDLSMLGQIFALAPTQNAMLAWGAFAFLLAYGYGLRLMLIAGILCSLGWLSATAGSWHGLYWISVDRQPEHFIPAGAVIFGLGFIPDRAHPSFPGAYRFFGLLAILVAVLVLGHWGEASMLPLSPGAAEHFYQVAGFALSGVAIWAGLRFAWPGIVNLGATAFAVLLFTKFYDWWWESVPKYLFFLLVGLTALLCLMVMRRLRAAAQGGQP